MLYARYVHRSGLETMQWVRQVFNPKGLANPGKIFPTLALVEKRQE
jgi:FAD/FMN-containing dehydrogenase